MSVKTEKKEIDGIVFTVRQLSPFEALPLHAKVMSIASPVLKGMSGLNEEGIAEGVSSLMASMGEDKKLFEILEKLCSYARRDGKEIKSLSVFDGTHDDPFVIYKVAFFVLEVNFKSFFLKFPNLKKKMAEKMGEIEEN